MQPKPTRDLAPILVDSRGRRMAFTSQITITVSGKSASVDPFYAIVQEGAAINFNVVGTDLWSIGFHGRKTPTSKATISHLDAANTTFTAERPGHFPYTVAVVTSDGPEILLDSACPVIIVGNSGA
jgi:hypothetical protein